MNILKDTEKGVEPKLLHLFGSTPFCLALQALQNRKRRPVRRLLELR
jgi:hypothetical protein